MKEYGSDPRRLGLYKIISIILSDSLWKGLAGKSGLFFSSPDLHQSLIYERNYKVFCFCIILFYGVVPGLRRSGLFFFTRGTDIHQRNYILLADIRYLFLVSPSILSPPPPSGHSLHFIPFRPGDNIFRVASRRKLNIPI